MALKDLRNEIDEAVTTLFAPAFTFEVTDTAGVPHSSDAAITFPNFDQQYQRTKLLETTVLYADMRRSTQLNFEHRRPTVGKLYTAFVLAMTRAATYYGGEVRGIIGDRVMVIFEQANCFTKAFDTAILINSVCKYIINTRFAHNEVQFGIGIDYGRMMATKTGIYRRGAAQQSYRSLVWLGRPANVASKLTDNANKPEDSDTIDVVNVCYDHGQGPTWVQEYTWDFLKAFTLNALTNTYQHWNPTYRRFSMGTQKWVRRKATPPILMTEAVYKGLKRDRPTDLSIISGWLKATQLRIPEYSGTIYGANVIFPDIKGP
jgi:adenylate cyclase